MENNIFLKISKFFHKLAKSWLILLILFFVFFLLALVIFPAFSSQSPKMISLDGPSFYSPQQIFSIIETWGEIGRSLQLWFHLTWDVLVPVLGLFLIGLSISWLTQRGFKPKSKMQKANLVALGSIFDLLENLCIVILILFYPSNSIIVAWLKTIFTSIKYFFGIVIILVILISLIKAIKNKFRIVK